MQPDCACTMPTDCFKVNEDYYDYVTEWKQAYMEELVLLDNKSFKRKMRNNKKMNKIKKAGHLSTVTGLVASMERKKGG